MDIKKECSHFKRDIVKELEDKKSMTMSAEKVMRYIQDKIKAKVKENFRFIPQNVLFLIFLFFLSQQNKTF